MSLRLSCLALLLVPAATAAQQAKYARPELLIEASQLARPEVAEKFRILDTRPKDKFDAGHIYRASRVDTKAWGRDFNAKDQTAWEKILGGYGIDLSKPVVVYGDDMREAARVWWILRYWGVRDVRILDGGWQAYQAAKGKTDRRRDGAPPSFATTPMLKPRPEILATREQLLRELKGEKRLTILDVRSQGEHCGDVMLSRRGGAIPGARHLEWSDVLDEQKQHFKAPAALAKLFKDAGIDPKRPTATYCQSGGRAAVMAFALELMGGQEVRNYYRSWAEWGNADDTPIVTPKKK